MAQASLEGGRSSEHKEVPTLKNEPMGAIFWVQHGQ